MGQMVDFACHSSTMNAAIQPAQQQQQQQLCWAGERASCGNLHCTVASLVKSNSLAPAGAGLIS